MSSNESATASIYSLIAGLPRFDLTATRAQLPANGVYLFFDRGETIETPNGIADRIVRVGTLRVVGRFPGRIRTHARGNRRASVFGTTWGCPALTIRPKRSATRPPA